MLKIYSKLNLIQQPNIIFCKYTKIWFLRKQRFSNQLDQGCYFISSRGFSLANISLTLSDKIVWFRTNCASYILTLTMVDETHRVNFGNDRFRFSQEPSFEICSNLYIWSENKSAVLNETKWQVAPSCCNYINWNELNFR